MARHRCSSCGREIKTEQTNNPNYLCSSCFLKAKKDKKTKGEESKIIIEERQYEPFLDSGNTQWFISSPKGKISLICLPRRYYPECPWEIYCLEGNLFEDVERFSTHEASIKKSKVYLT